MCRSSSEEWLTKKNLCWRTVFSRPSPLFVEGPGTGLAGAGATQARPWTMKLRSLLGFSSSCSRLLQIRGNTNNTSHLNFLLIGSVGSLGIYMPPDLLIGGACPCLFSGCLKRRCYIGNVQCLDVFIAL
jgi:hypothetical protein